MRNSRQMFLNLALMHAMVYNNSKNNNPLSDYNTEESYQARDYLAATMQFIPGHFACNVVWRTIIHIHPRLKMGLNMGVSRGQHCFRQMITNTPTERLDIALSVWVYFYLFSIKFTSPKKSVSVFLNCVLNVVLTLFCSFCSYSGTAFCPELFLCGQQEEHVCLPRTCH